MDNYSPAAARRPTRRPPNRRRSSAAVGILLFFIFTLGLVAGARWFVQQGIAFGPTPTVTPTRRTATETPTVDFRATRNVVELATQRARDLAMAGIDTPTPLPTETPTPTPTATTTLASVGAATETPVRTVIVNIPGLVVQPTGAPPPTAPPTDVVPTPDETAIEDEGTPLSTAEPPAVETPIATEEPLEETPTAIDTPTETSTETPISPATPTATLQPVVSLQAFTNQIAIVYAGPSTRYTRTNLIPVGQRVVMQGRNPTGEWIYLCCEFNIDGWTRQINLDIRDNQLPPNAPANANPNEARWLVESRPSATPVTPAPMQTPIPDGDFPRLRRDQAAQGYVPHVILPNWSREWDSLQLLDGFSSPPIVVRQTLVIANEDRHIIGYDRQGGNQRWRYDVEQLVTVAPAAQVTDGNLDIYSMDQSGRVLALREQGNSAVLLWAESLGTAPKTALNVSGDLLFVTGQNGVVYARNRLNGARVWDQSTEGNNLQYPVVGDELLFVANQRLTALDIYNGGEMVWQSDESYFNTVTAPPVYASPGLIAMAEVYVADGNGVVHAFDAATGRRLWFFATGQRIDMMAVDRFRVYTVGGQTAYGISRSTGNRDWSTQLVAPAAAGPYVGEGQVLFVSTGGTLMIYQSTTGEWISGSSTGATSVVLQPALGDGQIFIPAANNIIYTMREER